MERIPDTQPDPAVFGDYELLEAGERIPPTENKNMQKMISILSGGWAKGYRTQLLGIGVLYGTVVAWAVGDMSLADLVDKLPGLVTGAGLVFVGDKLDSVKKSVADAVGAAKGEVKDEPKV